MWPSEHISPPLSPVTAPRSISVFPPCDMYNANGDLNSISPHSSSPSARGKLITAAQKRAKYLRRLFHFGHMDFEFAAWEMIYLFTSPQKVYRNFHYRKEARNQWARDDPAFLVLLTIVLIVTSLGFALVLGFGFWEVIKFELWVTLIDCVGVGVCVASLLWLLANRMLRPNGHRASQTVEWAYAFDVHMNAFLPLVVILHLVQLPFLYPVILNDWLLSRLFGNLFWLVAILYYVYITFLGYSCLHFLHRTQILLYPMTAMVLVYILSLPCGWNFTRMLCNFYLYRVR